MDRLSLNQAAVALKANGIIAHYTDTVAGLACLPKALLLHRLERMKLRSGDKGFILLASHVNQLRPYLQCTPEDLERISARQVRPTTWLVPATSLIPPVLVGNKKTLAIRVTQHKEIQKLCECVGPIASTSANLSGLPVCSNLQSVRKMFGPQIDFIDLTQDSGSGKPSTIIDLQSGSVVRP